MFDIVTRVSSACWSIVKFCAAALLWVSFWGAITATSIFGFYFISGGVMAVFSAIALLGIGAFLVWSIGFIWKCIRFFFPKIEPIVKDVSQA